MALAYSSRKQFVLTPSQVVKELPIPFHRQEQKEWCWAACAEMCCGYYQIGAPQCESANLLFEQSGCCTDPSSGACNKPCPVGDVERVLDALGLRSQFVGSNVKFSVLRHELEAERPIGVGYKWTKGRGHAAVVYGWGEAAGGPFLTVYDPWYKKQSVYYTDLLKAYGYGSWNWTWTGIQR